MNYKIFTRTITLITLLFSTITTAQFVVVNENLTPQQLVQNILINNPCAGATNISATGHDFPNGKSYGYFSAGNSNFPFAEGIVLSTGRAASVKGPNNTLLSEGPTSWPGDPDLEDALNIGQSSINATILEFDFLPLSSKFSFEYIFASEQYLINATQNQCNYTDGFTFLLKEANTNNAYQNLAVLPGTNTPVKVNTVRGNGSSCPAANPEYFAQFNGNESPINFNGQTVVMKAQADVIPGVLYHIKLVVADQGNNLYDSAIFLNAGSFKVEKDLGPDRLIATNNPVCIGESYVLDATELGNNTYQWYKNNVIINGANQPTYTVNSGENGLYKVEINYSNAGCVASSSVAIEFSQPINLQPVTLVGCDINFPGKPQYNLNTIKNTITGNNSNLSVVNFYETENSTTPILNIASYISEPKTIFAMVKNQYGCTKLTPLILTIANNEDFSQSNFETCDIDEIQDGITEIDLNQLITDNIKSDFPDGLTFHYFENDQEAELEENEISGVYTTINAYNDTIWLKIKDGNNCYLAKPIHIKINTFSPIGFENESKILCAEEKGIELLVIDAYEAYLWDNIDHETTNKIFVTEPGIYKVKVFNEEGCFATKTFNVEGSSIAAIIAIDKKEFGGGKNKITINTSGSCKYLYSTDGISYQDSNTFDNLRAGKYLIHVKDQNGCGIATKEVYVIDYPTYFTPNNDGYNDTWQIQFLKEFYPNAFVQIFDRYGKLIYKFYAHQNGWDGTLNGRNLLADDYWFTINFEDGNTIKSHFSLKR